MEFENFIEYIYDTPYEYPERRYIRDAENPVEFYNSVEFQRRYRFRKETVLHILLPLIFGTRRHENNRGLPVPPLTQLLLSLRFFATGNFQIVCGDLHKLSQSVASRIVGKTADVLCRKMGQFIKFPQASDLPNIKRRFFLKAGFPGALGCIDCTHIPIKNPHRERGEVFRNRKGWFSINVQIVCGPDMEIYDIVARWPGSVHDSRIFTNSRCCVRFESGELNGILIGDGGYAQTSYMFTPVPTPRTQAEIRYNRSHIQTRNIIERLNGVLKRRFACLARKLQNNLQNTCNIIVACAVLHNISITSNEDILEPAASGIVPVPNAQDTQRGTLIRSAFITRHFS